MTVETGTRTSGLATLFQIAGAIGVIGIAVVAAIVLFHFVTAAMSQVLPLLVIGAVVYVLLRLVMEAGSSD